MKCEAKTEEQLRDSKAPSPKTAEELSEYIASLVDMRHDYGTCVYAMSLAATAAFNYVAGALGVTGFQAGCADLDVIRRTRGMNNGFCVVDYHDALYPQYDIVAKVRKNINEALANGLREKAAELLKESPIASPSVVGHWKRVAAGEFKV